jgi:hypothetical protein
MTHASLLSTDWPPYVVVSIGRDPEAGEDHDHVQAVETRDPDGGETHWGSQEVIAAIRDGERFVVDGDAGAELQPAACPACGRTTLVTAEIGQPQSG